MNIPTIFILLTSLLCILFLSCESKYNETDKSFSKNYRNASNESKNFTNIEFSTEIPIILSPSNSSSIKFNGTSNENIKKESFQKVNSTTTLNKILRMTVKNWRFDENYLGLDPYKESLKLGYPAENHIVETDDGYILTVLRIPHGINNTNILKVRPIVYIQPGLFCSAACFIDFGPDHSLGYILADAGFDVWITNPRGTTFSRNHTTYNPMNSSKYWDFSWHEIGTIDIPNTIDYILEKTEQKQINYIGHSQGTTALFVMLSEKPEYNLKIKVALAMAPVAFLENFGSDVKKKFAAANTNILKTIKSFGMYEILPHNKILTTLINNTCHRTGYDRKVNDCNRWLALGLGYQQKRINPENVHLVAQHFPAGGSIKQIEHFSQLITNGGFKKYDYGEMENYKIYGQRTPPSYNLSNINATIYLVHGEFDVVSTPFNVYKLHELLPTSRLLRHNVNRFSYNDFSFAENASQSLYRDMKKILYEYNEDCLPKE